LKREVLERVVAAREARRALVVLTWLDGSRQELVFPEELLALAPVLRDAAGDALRSDRAASHEVEGATVFVQPHNPPLRMVIVGAVHIGQHLAPMARSAGYDVTVVDPRSAFATAERFPGIGLSRQWPDKALAAIGLDARVAVVTLTHDPKLDDPALLAALESPVFYIGALGSRRTQGKRVERLRDHGVADDAIARIHGPVGLDIGARSPAEIAVSILAQVTERLRGQA
jgi:xanthine dehydrogenase accessory factor